MEKKSFIDSFTMFAVKLGAQIHLRSLRDAFAATMPIFILAGVAVLINNVIFKWFLSGDMLTNAQHWGNVITNGTLNVAGLLIAPMIAYCLSKNKGFKNPISTVVVSLAVLIIMMPTTVAVMPNGGDALVDISKVIRFEDLGTKGMFAGIIVGLLSTELYIWLTKVKQFRIHLGDDVPEAVGNSFSVMLPVMFTLSIFGVVAFILAIFLHTDLITLVATILQEPLRKVGTSLVGTLVIYSFGNFLFTIGIHQNIIYGTLLNPLLLVNTNENMLAYAAGDNIPNIINSVFVPTFGMLGGTGSTICLLIATVLFSKSRTSRDIAKLATAPGLFNINEPVIFGYPIVFNVPLMIPFVAMPAIGVAFAYFMTAIGFMDKTVVMIPWTTPPLLSAYLATAGDWKAVIVQLIILIVGVLIYLPFMKISENVAAKAAEVVVVEEE